MNEETTNTLEEAQRMNEETTNTLEQAPRARVTAQRRTTRSSLSSLRRPSWSIPSLQLTH